MRNDENLSIKGKSLSPLPDNKRVKVNLNKLLNKLQSKSLKLVRKCRRKKNKLSKKRNINIQLESKINSCLKEINESLQMLEDMENKNMSIDIDILNKKQTLKKGKIN